MFKTSGTFRYLTNLTPLFLMAGLSLFSIVLVKKSIPTATSDAVKVVSQQHNYYLEHFFVSQFNGLGDLKMYVNADSAFHFEQPQQLSVQNLNFYHLNRLVQYQGSAKSALIDDSGDSAKLFDQVKILRTHEVPSIVTMMIKSNYVHLTKNSAP